VDGRARAARDRTVSSLGTPLARTKFKPSKNRSPSARGSNGRRTFWNDDRVSGCATLG
jgi:hypothetical protein